MNPTFELTLDDLQALQIDWKIGGIADPIGQIANYIVSTLESAFYNAISSVQTVVSGIVNGAIASVNAVLNSISSSLSTVRLTIQNLPSSLTASLSSFTSQISGTLNNIVSAVSSSISGISSSIQSGFSSVLGSLNGIIGSLEGSIRSIAPQIQSSLQSIASSLTGAFQSVGSTLSSIGSQISSGINSAFAQVVSVVNSIGSQLSTISGSISSTLNAAFASIGPAFSAVGAQILSGLTTAFNQVTAAFMPLTESLNKVWNAITSLKLPDLSSVVSFALAFGKDPIGTIVKSIDTLLTDFGLPTIEQIEKVIIDHIPDLSAVIAFVTAFGKDPIGTIHDAIDTALKDLGLPTLEDMQKAITDFFNGNDFKNIFKDLFAWPAEFSSFLTYSVQFLERGFQAGSDTGFDNFFNFFEEMLTAFSATGIFGSLMQSAGWQSFLSGKGLGVTLGSQTDFFKPLTDFLTTLWTTIQQDVSAFSAIANKMFRSLVSGATAAYGLPTPKAGVTDAFEMIGSTVTQLYDDIAGMVPTKNFISNDSATKTLETVLAVIGATEALEFGALTVEALYPTKKLQFMDKLKRSFHKIGLGEVTGIVGGALVAVSLRPFFSRYFNKISQIQLIGPGELTQMQHRGLIAASDLDEFLQEHGYNEQFRNGIIELAHPLVGYMTAAQAYFRAIAFEGFSSATALTELSTLMEFQGVNNVSRKGFSFDDVTLLKKIVYELPSRFILRSLWLTGQLTAADMAKLFTASGMMPEYVQKAAAATILQGQLPFMKAQESAFATQVKEGYETVTTFTTMLQQIGYPASFIAPTVAAAAIQADNTVDTLTVSEWDKQYTEGFCDQATYLKNITPCFTNADIFKVHTAIADLARQRLDNERVRAAGTRAISEELIAFAEGAVSAKEFETICIAMGKTSAEITALEAARKIYTANLVRVAKFRTYQTELAKLQITPDQFKTLCAALPIDPDLVAAALQRILTALLPKPKAADVQQALILAQAQTQVNQ